MKNGGKRRLYSVEHKHRVLVSVAGPSWVIKPQKAR